MTQDQNLKQFSLTMVTPYYNQFLFSDHYLNHLLPRDSRWDAASDEATAFYVWLREMYAREGDHLDNYNESQLEDHWFIPIFERLGHIFERRASVPSLEKHIRQPDYVFFPTTSDRQAAAAIQKTDEYARHALAVGEVKQWDVHLSKKQRGGGGTFDRQNPSFQIDYYLKITGLTWGILSNGRVWRLVHRETSYRLDTYYEVDLLKLLEQDDPSTSSGQVPAAIRYFYLFFRQAAFQPDAQGRVFLDDVLASSAAYALALEEDLQENAYRALELLIQGFLDYAPNVLAADDLRAIYDNSLYLLYRLLFILYGESRGLLPVDNPRYRSAYGLAKLKQDVAAMLDAGEFVSAHSDAVYGRLKNLFRLINGADLRFNADIGMPRYNGGLFDPQQHPFLQTMSVGDKAFTQAVDLLSRRTSESGIKEFVDYRTLNVRHLGSIYEGLLEYQPRLANESMVAVRNGNGELWMPEAESPKSVKITARRQPGEVYLETDKGERKATGSYYTPQYIVAYIVEQTLGPLVEKWRGENGASLTDQNLVDAVLNLKVLDPAMGSGHFLVEATDYLARVLATDPHVEADDAEGAAESDLNHWRRRVVERCIYGVDKNPLAVELAKLSLWLTTFAADKPLGFLDHHLKCGDSLVGARIATLEEQPAVLLSKKTLRQREKEAANGAEQLGLGLFAGEFNRRLPEMLRELFAIMDAESADYEAVRAKEAAHTRVERLKAPFQTIADLHTSAHFGNTYSEEAYKAALRAIGEPEQLHALPAVQAAQAIAAERLFLHWELTFPEIFFDRVGVPLPEEARGFDAVIGNPPYIQLSMGEYVDPYLKTYLPTAYDSSMGRLNTFGFFLKRGIDLMCDSGYESMIVPNTILTMTYYTELRRMILETCRVKRILTFDNLPFEDAVVENVVIVLQAESDKKERSRNLTEVDIFARTSLQVIGSHSIPQKIFMEWHENVFNPQLTPKLLAIRAKLQKNAILLGNLVHINQAIALKHDRAKWLFDRNLGADFHPLLDGRDIGRYQIDFPNVYLKYDLEAIHSCKREDIFQTDEKLLFRRVGDRIIACYDNEQFYALNTLVVINLQENIDLSLKFLLTFLNSGVLDWYFVTFLKSTKDVFSEIQARQMEQLPIPRIDFTTPAEERAALVAQAIAYYEAALDATTQHAPRNAPTPLLAFTANQPTDVIHDLLAHLAEQMIALNRQKQQRVATFTLDLEGVTDAATFARLQKGKQGRTLWKAAACRPYVEEDSYTTHSLEDSLAWSENAYKAFVKKLAGKITGLSDLVAIYRAHAPDYAALVQRIAATDRIIDQIVYRLYGLTEEEIAIVEA